MTLIQILNAKKFELAAIDASEALATVLMIKRNSKGFSQCHTQSVKASEIVRDSLAD